MNKKGITKSQAVAQDVAALLRARNPLLWIITREEARAEQCLFEAAAAAGYVARTWDCGQGVCGMDGRLAGFGSPDPADTLSLIKGRADSQRERGVWIMRDLPAWLGGPIGMTTMRQLRNLARFLPGVGRDGAQAIIILSPSGDVPAELSGHTTVIEWPLPDREEIAELLDAAVDVLPDEIKTQAAPNGTRDAAIDAAVGLSGEEAQACFARSLVQLRRIDPGVVAGEKKRVIAREGLLEWYDPLPGGLDAVGGLDVLKGWLRARRSAYSPAAREYGLPAPKGALLVGIPGCGKSLTAKAVATAWGVPLLKLDLNALKGKFVGESEGKIRTAFRVIEAIGRCVVWLDEIEKALAGATQGAADGGVSTDALGVVLSWMQERKSEAFVVATANDVSSLPPELLRKGRFDEVFWVDLPTAQERAEILLASLRAFGRKPDIFVDSREIAAVVAATNGFTGSEIAAIVPDALFVGFEDDKREIAVGDLVEAARKVVPLSKTAKERIEGLRSWAEGRARPATSILIEGAPSGAVGGARRLDLE